ncbi:MAG: serine hydroxymethyltransferase [Candidatus Dojkabacteria bacterium]|nr:serine hydroxymethyltransferase [Candidatus Dojkabacteria bacterium]
MDIETLIKRESEYQQKQLKLIPSENYVSPDVRAAVGSVFMNKYAEGQVGKRYYQGNKFADQVEQRCKELALKAFHVDRSSWQVNVQAPTGSIANLAVYSAILEPEDSILSMYLPDGGHLSHGWKLPDGKPVSVSSKFFQSSFYRVSPDTGRFDYDEIEKTVRRVKPRLIITGGTAYPRVIDYQKIGEIAHRNGAYYLADIAHEAGLIAGNAYPSPFPHADIVTMTSRKTLRGPVGALIFSKDSEISKEIDTAVFPGLTGGPMLHSIAGIAVALEEAHTDKFRTYAKQVLKNAQILASELISRDFNLVTGGTDNHLILIDVRNKQPDGLIAAVILESADIITNKNSIPANGDLPLSLTRPPGLRIGTPAVTTRGMEEGEMKVIASLIDDALSAVHVEPDTPADDVIAMCSHSTRITELKKQVHSLTGKFPVY